jgi:hypothetical protein
MAMFEMVSKALPMFESITLCAALVVPVFCGLNVRLGGERLTTGAGGGGELPPPPPPPQAAQTPITSNAVAKSQAAGRRRAVAKLSSVARANNAAKSHGHPTCRRKLGGTRTSGGGAVRLVAPVVVMVSVVVTGEVPVTLKFWGETVQENPEVQGGPEQVMFIDPVNPFRGVTVIVEVPVCPGAEMLMVEGLADKLKSVTLTVVAFEVEPA